MRLFPELKVEFFNRMYVFFRSNVVSGRLGMLLSGLWLRFFQVQGRCGQKDPRKLSGRKFVSEAIMAHPRGKSHRLRNRQHRAAQTRERCRKA